MCRMFQVGGGLAILLVAACGWANAQESSPTRIADIERQLQELRGEKARLEQQLRTLRDGTGGSGLLAGVIENHRFRPLGIDDGLPRQGGLFLPVSPQNLANALATRLWNARAGFELAKKKVEDLPRDANDARTQEALEELVRAKDRLDLARAEVKDAVQWVLAGAIAMRSEAVREGLARADADYRARLADVNAAIAALEAERARLLGTFAAVEWQLPGALAVMGAPLWPSAPTAVRNPTPTGKGVVNLSGPCGTFTVTGEGAETRLVVDFVKDFPVIGDSSTWRLVGTGKSFNPEKRILSFTFEVNQRSDPLRLGGPTAFRGKGSLAYGKGKGITITFESMRTKEKWVQLKGDAGDSAFYQFSWDAAASGK